jgi:hypothetical protein
MSTTDPSAPPTPKSPPQRRLGAALLLGGIFVAALLLRLWGIGFGLPYEYHPDEDQYVRQAATMGSQGLQPADWFNPPLFKYLLLAEYGAYYAAGRLLGWFASTADFGARLSVDPTPLYLLGRGTSALLGALSVLVVAWIGTKAYSRAVGVFAAALMAAAFLPVREAHFAVNDAAVTLLISLVLLGAVGMVRTGERRWYLLGGAALGLGFATKYHALAAAAPLLLAHAFAPGVSLRTPRLGRLLAAFGLAAVSAVLASPYFVLTPGEAWADVSRLFQAGQVGYLWRVDVVSGYVFYLKTLIWGLGWPLAGLLIFAALAGLLRRRAVDWVLLCLPWLMYLYLGRQEMFFGRFMLPIVAPLMVVGASLLLEAAAKYLPAGAWRTSAVLGAWLILALPTLAASMRFDYLLTQTDTRTLAKQWIEQNLPDGASVAQDWLFHCPPLSTAERPRANSSRTYLVWTPGIDSGTGLADHPLDWYRQNGYEYLIACSSVYRLRLMDYTLEPGRQQFYAALDEQLELLHTLRPTDDGREPPFIFDEIYGPAVSLWQRQRPGPTIKIYRLGGQGQP